MALYVSDLGKARAFYEDFLGFAEPFSLKQQDGTDWISVIKVNDRQYLELFPGNTQSGGQLSHIALYTDDVVGMRNYLLSCGVKVPQQVHKGQAGDSFFTVSDPDGHLIEIVQYAADSQTATAAGKSMPLSRVSSHISHVGLLVGQAAAAMKFYGDILGLREIWRGAEGGKQVSWIDMRVPDGTDYVEFMLYQDSPSLEQRKLQNHIGFASADVQKTVQVLQSQSAANSYSRSIDIQSWVNGKRVTNLFDPDGARMEIMESQIADGK
ncbi:MAG TPA: VOC family protein [Terriglobales bacterium]|nr:VOC family protein [Terriglobales bacterium]